MKVTTGIDLLEVHRMERCLRREGFSRRCFSEEELAQHIQRGSKPAFLAGNFCAKEAFSKALGTGVRGFSLPEVEVLRDVAGKPYLRFWGQAGEIVAREGFTFDVSITNTKAYAAAVVVAYRE